MDNTVIGATGIVIVATRGGDGPGEVSLRLGGGTESYLAWSEVALTRGTEVVVVDRRGPRTVEVTPLDDSGISGASSEPLLDLQ